MNQRTEYLLQVLEKIGFPLMTSILQAPGRGVADETQRDAQRIAELLAKTTQASIEMSRAIDFSAEPDHGDALRVALAALASGLVGSYFKHSGKAPTDNDLKKMTAAMQTVLTFSENFVPGADASVRMSNLKATGQVVDTQQAGLQYIHAFIPVVNAVTAFPFGQPEQKLIMDVSARLLQKTTDLRTSLFGNLPPDEQNRVELSLVSVLTNIYAVCHDAETARLMALSEEQRSMGGLGLDSVWKAFDLRVSILEILAKTLVPPVGETSAAGSKAPKPAATTLVPPPVQVQPVQQPPVQKRPTGAPPQTGSNPLSMFAKRPEGESPPPQPSAPPPPAAPPAKPPTGNPPPAQQSGGSSPMGFFKKPPEKE